METCSPKSYNQAAVGVFFKGAGTKDVSILTFFLLHGVLPFAKRKWQLLGGIDL